MNRADLYAFDCETHLIQKGLIAPPLVCGSFCSPDADPILLSKADTLAKLHEILPAKYIVGANVVYDLAVVINEDPSLLPLVFQALEEGRIFSTDILEQLHDIGRGCLGEDPITRVPSPGYSLGKLASRYLNLDLSADKHGEDSWRLRYALLEDVPLEDWPSEAVRYAKDDAKHTLDIALIQLGDGRFNLQCNTSEMRAAWFLHLSAVWGLRTDPDMVPVVVAGIRSKHIELQAKFLEVGLVKTRVARGGKDAEVPDFFMDMPAKGKKEAHQRGMKYQQDNLAVAAMVVEAYQGSPPVTEGGKTSTARFTLTESGNPLLEELGEAGANKKLLSTYVDVLEQGTIVPINPTPNVLVNTARTSYRKPNLQQLPRGGSIRECFKFREVGCSVDYGTLELVTLSQVCLNLFGHSTMAEALQAGQDLHTRLAARIGGTTYEAMIQRLKDKDPEAKNLRQLAKPINFGLPGGMGPAKLAFTALKEGTSFCVLSGEQKECGITKEVFYNDRPIAPTCSACLILAAKFRDLWREEWPEMRKYHKHIAALTRDGAGTLTSFGNGMVRSNCGFTDGSNHLFQNLAAQGAKHAGWLLCKEMYTDVDSPLYGSRIVVFVHDEMIVEIPESKADVAAWRVSEVMIGAMATFCPNVPVKAEPALQRRWFKGADKALDKNGKLKPWWPKDWKWEPDQEQLRKDNSL